jgi:beta-glucuronidase
MLRPIDNALRERRSLNGLWQFAVDGAGTGRTQQWWSRPLAQAREIPVPASYNDIFPDGAVRDHVGDVWYQVHIQVPAHWQGRRSVLRFDAATHRATVWLGDVEIVSHEGGYMPFEADITPHVQAGGRYRLTVCVNNELHWHTIPPGRVITLPDGRRRQEVFHDFFNYAGLARSVWLYSTPSEHFDGLTVETDYSGNGSGGPGVVHYASTFDGQGEVVATLLDAEGQAVGEATGANGRIALAHAIPWQPGSAYLYALVLELKADGIVKDSYTLPVGIRTVKVAGRQLLINGSPFYFTGFGMHEDSVVRGKGHDDVVMVNDFALLEWMGANSFRTSHYPYAEEMLDHADRHGIVVIDETAAVGMNLSLSIVRAANLPKDLFSEEAISSRTQATHLQAIRELIARDRNHPCVVMWSVANEPDVRSPESRAYFEPLIAETRRLDASRPLTVANVQFCGPDNDSIADLLDVLCLNRYPGWYRESGDLVAAEAYLDNELRAWTAKYDKPLMLTEFGCDAVPGLHAAVPSMWTEEYQTEFIAMFQRVLDRQGTAIGEHVWCFADFATPQGPLRVGGNRKGVFTRDRQPKAAALRLRQRWLGLRKG